MSDPRRWDRWGRTIARPLTGRRLAGFIAYRVFVLATISTMTLAVLVAAVTSQTQRIWTLFAVIAVLWVISVVSSAWVTCVVLKARRGR